MSKYFIIGRYYTTLGTLLEEKLDLRRALEAMADAESEPMMKDFFLRAIARVDVGESIEKDIFGFADGDVSSLQSFIRTMMEKGRMGRGFLFSGKNSSCMGNRCDPVNCSLRSFTWL